jgi:hypothetical protein
MGMDASSSQPYMHRHTGISRYMRLLLYFLALLTGISAADAARPVDAASPTSAALQLDIADSVVSNVAATIVSANNVASSDYSAAEVADFTSAAMVVPASTPVSRADRARK